MKKYILGLLLILLYAGSLNAQRIKGSETVLPITQKAAENFIKSHSRSDITVTGGGSGVGIASLLSGTTDIAQTSRRIKFDERKKIKFGGNDLKEVEVAFDALAIVVHPSNKVSRLTREQLQGIFTGKIKNWKEVGGEDLKIIPYSRETSSGTYEFFKESVLKNKNFMSGIMSMPANGAVIQSVSQTRGAIAYVGLAYLSDKVKAISVSYDSGKTFVKPSVKTAKDKSYPIVRPLYYYYLSKDEAKVKDFLEYLLSPAGQKIVEETGYVPVS